MSHESYLIMLLKEELTQRMRKNKALRAAKNLCVLCVLCVENLFLSSSHRLTVSVVKKSCLEPVVLRSQTGAKIDAHMADPAIPMWAAPVRLDAPPLFLVNSHGACKE